LRRCGGAAERGSFRAQALGTVQEPQRPIRADPAGQTFTGGCSSAQNGCGAALAGEDCKGPAHVWNKKPQLGRAAPPANAELLERTGSQCRGRPRMHRSAARQLGGVFLCNRVDALTLHLFQLRCPEPQPPNHFTCCFMPGQMPQTIRDGSST
jgi:hypothetical protein